MKINKLKLREIVSTYEIMEQEFEYAGINGIAELLGWQIIFFRKKEDPINTVAILFNEIVDIEIINIANSILEFIDVDIRFGDNIQQINNVYGIADFTDYIYDDMIRCNYIISPELLMVFGFEKNKLSYLEIAVDEIMINQILSIRMD